MEGPQRVVTAIGAFFLVTTWVTTMLRIYVRVVMIKNFGAEDYLAVFALALFTAGIGIALKGIAVSGGKHFTQLTLPEIKSSMELWFLLELFYTACITVIRASLGIFLLRITITRAQMVIVWVVLVTITAYSIFYFFFVIFQCNPPAAFWTEVGGNSAYCVKASTFGTVTYIHSGLGAFSDWVLTLLPVFLVSNLSLNIRTKISVSIILGLGGIAAIAVIVRIPYVKILVNSTDFLYDCTDVVVWTAIEPGLGLTAASLATLRPLFQAFLSRTRLFGTTRSPSGAQQSGYGKSTTNYSRPKTGYFRKADLEMKIGAVVTVINAPGFEKGVNIEPQPQPDGDQGSGKNRSESQTRLSIRKMAENWQARRVSDGSNGEGGEGPVLIRKTVEITTQSGISL